MPNCAISTCKHYSRVTKNTAIRYFRFPEEENFAKKWVIACCRKDKINLENARICSVHFAPDCFEIPLRQRLLNYKTTNSRVLKNDAVPTLNTPKKSYVRKQPSSRSFRMAIKKQTQEVKKMNASSTTLEFTPNIPKPVVNHNEMDFDDIIGSYTKEAVPVKMEGFLIKDDPDYEMQYGEGDNTSQMFYGTEFMIDDKSVILPNNSSQANLIQAKIEKNEGEFNQNENFVKTEELIIKEEYEDDPEEIRSEGYLLNYSVDRHLKSHDPNSSCQISYDTEFMIDDKSGILPNNSSPGNLIQTEIKKNESDANNHEYIKTEEILIKEYEDNPKEIHSGGYVHCTICAKKLLSRSFDTHLKLHDPNYICEHCGKCFTHDYEYILHTKVHTKGYICIHCQYYTDNQYVLSKHMQLHMSEVRLKCEFCVKTYSIATLLQFHVARLHPDADTIHKRDIAVKRNMDRNTCKICMTQYTNRIRLIEHMRAHNMTICHVCQRVLDLNEVCNHLNMNSQITILLHHCNYCEETFSHKSQLIKHQHKYNHKEKNKVKKRKKQPEKKPKKKTDNRFPCTICNNVYRKKSTLARHMKSRVAHINSLNYNDYF